MVYATFIYPPYPPLPEPKLTHNEPIRWTQVMPPEQPHPFRYVYDELIGDFVTVVDG